MLNHIIVQLSFAPPPQRMPTCGAPTPRGPFIVKSFEDERIRLFDSREMKMTPLSSPVESTTKLSQRSHRKKFIFRSKEFLPITFFGLLVGPRGKIPEEMRKDMVGKISKSRKCSVTEGKARPDHMPKMPRRTCIALYFGRSESKSLCV